MEPSATPIPVRCERCGYALDGLELTAACPECALAAAGTVPERRTGTAWQQARRVRIGASVAPLATVRAWLTTNFQTLRHPVRTFEALRIEPRSGTLLLWINLLLAGALIVDPWLGTLIGDPARAARMRGGAAGLLVQGAMFLAEALAVALVLFLLTWIEVVGVRFFGRGKGWHLTRNAAWQVCAHASIGWVALGIAPVVLLAGLQAAQRLFAIAPTGVLDLRPIAPVTFAWTSVIYTLGLCVSLLVGMLSFEVLVALGVRACKHACDQGTYKAFRAREAARQREANTTAPAEHSALSNPPSATPPTITHAPATS